MEPPERARERCAKFGIFRSVRRRSLGCTAFHDEIKPELGRNSFLAHGVLFVPDDWIVPLFGRLQEVRQRYDFWEETHFREIRSGSPRDRQFQVAAGWLSAT
jgi:hypothetical protein